jgi:hypothetical protein
MGTKLIIASKWRFLPFGPMLFNEGVMVNSGNIYLPVIKPAKFSPCINKYTVGIQTPDIQNPDTFEIQTN